MDWNTLALWLLALQLWELRAAIGRHRRQLRDGMLYLGRDLSGLRRQELRRIMGLPALALGLLVLSGCGWGSRREGRETTREIQRPDGAGGLVIERETVRSETAEHTMSLPTAAAVAGAGIDLAATLGGAGGVAGAGALVLALLKRRQQHTTALERA